MLLTILVSAILEIRYLNAISAGDAFGFYNPSGVIAVRTQR